MDKKSGRYEWSDRSDLRVNEEHVKILIQKFDMMMAEIMADVNPFRGRNGRIKELSPSEVEKYNKYMGMYKEICNSELEFARTQDNLFNGLLRRFSRMEEKEDKIISLLEKKHTI